MKFLVLGATGATGSLLVQRALFDGHELVAYVRTPAKMTPREGLTVVEGDVRDADALAEAMRGTDGVISALGYSTMTPGDLITDSTRAIVQAAERSGTRRVVILSAFGVGDSLAKASTIARIMYSTGGKAIYADKAVGERILITSDLDWTLAYPVRLTNKPATGKARVIDLEELTRLPGMPKIPRADVAEFLLRAAVDDTWSRRTAVLTTGH